MPFTYTKTDPSMASVVHTCPNSRCVVLGARYEPFTIGVDAQYHVGMSIHKRHVVVTVLGIEPVDAQLAVIRCHSEIVCLYERQIHDFVIVAHQLARLNQLSVPHEKGQVLRGRDSHDRIRSKDRIHQAAQLIFVVLIDSLDRLLTHHPSLGIPHSKCTSRASRNEVRYIRQEMQRLDALMRQLNLAAMPMPIACVPKHKCLVSSTTHECLSIRRETNATHNAGMRIEHGRWLGMHRLLVAMQVPYAHFAIDAAGEELHAASCLRRALDMPAQRTNHAAMAPEHVCTVSAPHVPDLHRAIGAPCRQQTRGRIHGHQGYRRLVGLGNRAHMLHARQNIEVQR